MAARKAYEIGSMTEAAQRMRAFRAAGPSRVHECIGGCGRTMAFTKRGQTHWCCEDCRPARRNEAMTRYRTSNRDTIANRTMRLKYGLTIEEYEVIFDAQGGVCAVCGTPPNGRRLDVDHHHGSGRVRGLLCNNCNRGIGHLREDPDLLAAALAYLKGGQ